MSLLKCRSHSSSFGVSVGVDGTCSTSQKQRRTSEVAKVVAQLTTVAWEVIGGGSTVNSRPCQNPSQLGLLGD